LMHHSRADKPRRTCCWTAPPRTWWCLHPYRSTWSWRWARRCCFPSTSRRGTGPPSALTLPAEQNSKVYLKGIMPVVVSDKGFRLLSYYLHWTSKSCSSLLAQKLGCEADHHNQHVSLLTSVDLKLLLQRLGYSVRKGWSLVYN
jgi:hypothetical protein